ncbi:MAG: insulinase family protein [Oscillospiraceae bacterium]|nr:insulinase family protein [Oscillospiraceae bacterium]
MEKLYYPQVNETVYTETLPNGLTVRVMPKPDFNRAFAVFATDYGGADRRFSLGGEWIDTPAGIAHYLEHKMFDMPDGDNALNLLAMNGASPNAFTSSDITAYYFESTKGFKENLELLLRFVSTPYFTEETVEKERGIIAQEIGMYDDSPDFQIYMRLMEILYQNAPTLTGVAGTVESISQITADHLHSCHKAFYVPSNMVLSVVGNADPQLVMDTALAMLPSEKAPKPVVDYGAEESMLPLKQYTESVMEVSAPQFMLGSKVKPILSGIERLRQRHTGSLAMQCLFGRSSKFFTTLYSKNILNSDFDIDFDYAANSASLFLNGQSNNPKAVLEAVLAEADKVRKNGLDEKRFRRVKNATIGSMLFALEDFDNMAVTLAHSAFQGYNTLDAHTPAADVTAEECAAFIAENLTEEKLAMSVILPEGVSV